MDILVHIFDADATDKHGKSFCQYIETQNIQVGQMIDCDTPIQLSVALPDGTFINIETSEWGHITRSDKPYGNLS